MAELLLASRPAAPSLPVASVARTSAPAVVLEHGPDVPDDAALARRAEALRGTAPRLLPRLLLRLPVVLVPDGPAADERIARARALHGTTDAMVGVGWARSAAWLVTTPSRLRDEVAARVAATGADDVVLALTPSARRLLAA
ncbi:hypothetical protein [Cellulomonas marina]|uniref:Luciferase-like monooxygenase n=1 Tax=Cellulomonas marina TaxID=988821 RepID=A0A1I0Z086_9CELL|nr:hypothetical protein [Cellulomonas marina]GIG28150.1 hypothetical protein Cma02nite_07500 [Cellulomonas marina]SFB19024.1 hypothetical protein SAMN05421867_10990 [Cellulomonas marina]